MATARRPLGTKGRILETLESEPQSPSSADCRLLDKALKKLAKLHKLSTDRRVALKNSPPYLPEIISATEVHVTEAWSPYRGSASIVPRQDEGEYLRIHIRHLLEMTERVLMLFKENREKMFEEASTLSWSFQENSHKVVSPVQSHAERAAGLVSGGAVSG